MFIERQGNILILALLLMVVLAAMVAFAVDVGYVYNVRGEMQRAADAAAMAGGWELFDEAFLTDRRNMSDAVHRCKEKAADFVALNPISGGDIKLGRGDVRVGYMRNPLDRNDQLDEFSVAKANVVEVRLRNPGIPLFFARALGFDQLATDVSATAALLNELGGFRPPSDGSRLPILPIAVDLPSWKDLLEGGPDQYAWDAKTDSVFQGSDGMPELDIYPENSGAAGNRGTVDIGPAGNSTSHIADQIRNGIRADDLNTFHGGELAFDEYGELYLTGDTGISNSLKDDLAAVIGEPKVIPIFESVHGNGNNASYKVVRLVGARIMYVNMTGKNKRLVIQPANVVVRGGIPSGGSRWGNGITENIYSPVWLVR